MLKPTCFKDSTDNLEPLFIRRIPTMSDASSHHHSGIWSRDAAFLHALWWKSKNGAQDYGLEPSHREGFLKQNRKDSAWMTAHECVII